MQIRPASQAQAPAPIVKPMAAPAVAVDQLHLSQDEQAELDRWKNRFRPEMGQLQTSPIGPVPGPQEAAKNYVESLLQEVAGEDFKKQGIQLRIEVFSGDVPQLALDDSESLERNWREDHPDQSWPIRSWYGGIKNGRPLYRLNVNLGMLGALDSRDELAFLLSTQAEKLLAHDRKDQLNHQWMSPSRQNYLESRQMEAGADKMAIDRMAKAGFNPKGAFDALTKLYASNAPEYPKKDLDRGLIAASQGQEHEGLRMALVQTAVEQLKRSGHPSTAKPLTPLPANLDIQSPNLYETDLADFPTFRDSFVTMADELAQDKAPGWFFGEGQAPDSLRYLWAHRGSSADYEKALGACCDHLQSLDRTPQQRVDGFFRVLKSFDFLKSITPEGSAKIESFLSANQAGWSAEKFGQSLSNGQKTVHRSFVQQVVFNESFQHFLPDSYSSLIAAVPAWHSIDPDTNQSDAQSLPDLLKKNHGEKASSWDLSSAIDDAIVLHLNQLDANSLANETLKFGLPAGLVLSNNLMDVDDLSPELLLRIDKALDPVQAASAQTREDIAVQKLRAPYSNPTELNGFLKGLFRSEVWASFSPEFDVQLPNLLLDFTRSCSGQTDFVFDEDRPKGLEPGLEKRICALQGTDRQAVLREVTRNWVHERRVSSHSSRREWTAPLARSITKEELLAPANLSQHDNMLRRTYLDGYQLDDSALPDTSMESLTALNERRKEKEFEPKSEDYANDAEYWKAVDAYFLRCDQMEKNVHFIAPMEARLTLGKLALVGHDLKASQTLASQLNLGEFEQLLGQAELAEKRSELEMELTEYGGNEKVGVDSGACVLDAFLAVQHEISDPKKWYELCDRTLDFGDGCLNARVGARRQLGDKFFPLLEPLPEEELRKWMRRMRTLDLLDADQSSKILMKCATSNEVAELTKQVAQLDHEYRLRDEYPLVYRQLRDDLTVRAKLQPSTVDKVFPPEKGGAIEEMGPFKNEVRGLSGLVAMTRGRSVQEQLDTIEYLMGRKSEMPEFMDKAGESQDYAPLVESLQNAREDLGESDSNTRVLVANSFLAGPSGVLSMEDCPASRGGARLNEAESSSGTYPAVSGKELVMQHFLKGIAEPNQEMARKIAKAVLNSQGDADTLAVAYILAQKPKEGSTDTKMDEADILNRLFDAYGVPGIKMKQYLAFTSEFANYKEAFESAQDAALPLSQFQVLKLIQKRFGDQWPTDMKVDKVLGSGSVNVAIRYLNEKTGQREVVSLGREDIQEQTKYDFDRFHKFINELTSTPEDKEKFGYILGLLDIIDASVALEFDKESVLEVQKHAFKSYQHKYKDWTVRSIDAYKVENLGLFMEEAKGKTARKISEKNPALYKEAMVPMTKAEMGVLKGQDGSHNLRPKEMFANPDFHDGQVLIEEATKTVTILDFGQAVPIDNQQRKTGLDLLTIIGKGDSAKNAAKRMNKRFFDKRPVLSEADMKPLLERTQRMDIFVHLLSLLSQKGADVPISSVHWILGLNRQMALGERLDQPIEKQVRHMVINHKMGMPLALYNTAHAIKEKALEFASALSGCLGLPWAIQTPVTPTPSFAPTAIEKSEPSWSWSPASDFSS
jgi:hypothetical protein